MPPGGQPLVATKSHIRNQVLARSQRTPKGPSRYTANRATPTWQATLSSSSLCIKNIAEQFPRVALKPRQPVLLDGRKVGGGSIDSNTRLQHRRRKRPEVRCLRHDVFATEVIATPSKNLLQSLSHRVAQGG